MEIAFFQKQISINFLMLRSSQLVQEKQFFFQEVLLLSDSLAHHFTVQVVRGLSKNQWIQKFQRNENLHMEMLFGKKATRTINIWRKFPLC